MFALSNSYRPPDHPDLSGSKTTASDAKPQNNQYYVAEESKFELKNVQLTVNMDHNFSCDEQVAGCPVEAEIRDIYLPKLFKFPAGSNYSAIKIPMVGKKPQSETEKEFFLMKEQGFRTFLDEHLQSNILDCYHTSRPDFIITMQKPSERVKSNRRMSPGSGLSGDQSDGSFQRLAAEGFKPYFIMEVKSHEMNLTLETSYWQTLVNSAIGYLAACKVYGLETIRTASQKFDGYYWNLLIKGRQVVFLGVRICPEEKKKLAIRYAITNPKNFTNVDELKQIFSHYFSYISEFTKNLNNQPMKTKPGELYSITDQKNRILLSSWNAFVESSNDKNSKVIFKNFYYFSQAAEYAWEIAFARLFQEQADECKHLLQLIPINPATNKQTVKPPQRTDEIWMVKCTPFSWDPTKGWMKIVAHGKFEKFITDVWKCIRGFRIIELIHNDIRLYNIVYKEDTDSFLVIDWDSLVGDKMEIEVLTPEMEKLLKRNGEFFPITFCFVDELQFLFSLRILLKEMKKPDTFDHLFRENVEEHEQDIIAQLLDQFLKSVDEKVKAIKESKVTKELLVGVHNSLTAKAQLIDQEIDKRIKN